MYLDYAELQASRQIAMKMADWTSRLDAFLQFNDYQILNDAGKVSHEVAMKLAEQEYGKFRVTQDENFESDFDKEVKKLKKLFVMSARSISFNPFPDLKQQPPDFQLNNYIYHLNQITI